MLRKINDSESSKISQESVYYGVFLVKLYAYSVQTATVLYRDFTTDFPQYVLKSSCLKKNILRKNSMMENILIKLRSCSRKPVIFSKTELNRAHVRPVCRSAENSNVFTKNLLSGGFFSVKLQVYSLFLQSD